MRVTSKSLRGVTELTLIADIKPGLVNVAEPVAYSGRLKQLLSALFSLRSLNAEAADIVPLTGALERLRTLHFFNWSLFDHDRRLLLTVSFDGPWEPYIRQIVEVAGPLLDIIFCHCKDYERSSCLHGYPAFSEWVRDRQVEASLMYTAAPDLTVDDRRYLQHFEREVTNGANTIAGQAPAVTHVPDPSANNGNPVGRAEQAQHAPVANAKTNASGQGLVGALSVLLQLRRLFPNGATRKADDDLYLFDRAVELFTRHLRADAVVARWPNPVLQQWAENLPSVVREQPQRPAPKLEDSDNLQGNILEHYLYGEHEPTHGCLVFLRFDGISEAAGFLRGIRARLSIHGSASATTRVNLSLTYRGLQSAGASPALLAALPKEFQEGLEQRAGLLGDVGANHPSNWEVLRRNWPDPSGLDTIELSSVDAVLVLQAYRGDTSNDHEWTKAHPLYGEVEALANEAFCSGVQFLHVQPLRRHGKKSHFGLEDGISQPSPREPGDASRDAVALGELLLGYPNERNEQSPISAEFAKNSTFLVIRKMSQNVKAFEEVSLGSPVFKAKMLGRHPDGKPLLPSRDEKNDFDYQRDPEGRTCPLFSHVRRANPREEKQGADYKLPTPRILRRGMPYGPVVDEAALVDTSEDAATKRGILFMAYCSSIADQFEVIQKWVNGGNSTNGFSAHPDFVGGTFPSDPFDTGNRRTQAFFDGSELRRLKLPAQPTVQLRWGLYLFVPSIQAIDALVRTTEPGLPRGVLPKGDEPPVYRHLRDIEQDAPASALDEWRRFLEDPTLRADASAIWKYVRDSGGALRTAYGVLVGSPKAVREVLTDYHNYSVREYHRRMEESFGGHYLGMDPEVNYNVLEPPPAPDRYNQDSNLPNAFLSAINYTDTFARARELTLEWFAGQPGVAVLPDLVRIVVSQIAHEKFGLPDFTFMTADPDPGQPVVLSQPKPAGDRPPARCPVDFQNSAQYIFRPNPVEALEATAKRRGNVIFDVAADFVRQSVPSGPLLQYLEDQKFGGDLNAAVVGAINGFTVPTSSSFLSIMGTWIDTRELGRLRQWFSALTPEKFNAIATASDIPDCNNPLVNAMLRAFIQRPVPDLLHRTAVGDAQLGDVKTRPGERIVISLASAAIAAHAEADPDFWTLLFGGDYRKKSRPVHACPGLKMGLGALLGMICGVLSQKGLAPIPKVKLTLQYDPKWAAGLVPAKCPDYRGQ